MNGTIFAPKHWRAFEWRLEGTGLRTFRMSLLPRPFLAAHANFLELTPTWNERMMKIALSVFP
ncbi:hypothetical protein CA54_50760 [Symmachiella macrocystis]|uniref:Uncharacterized protein n=1 Tax=Symmachiella macrocystis TaxID=2527985 RepID=A0A5C6B4K6_9PLAN|nr:hypothetical protein CA54_50760 [Symmachiella macrocystis]